jgi:hypothetical protein
MIAPKVGVKPLLTKLDQDFAVCDRIATSTPAAKRLGEPGQRANSTIPFEFRRIAAARRTATSISLICSG